MTAPQGPWIRDAAIERLKGLTINGRPWKKVLPIRMFPVQVNHLPQLCVFIQDQRAIAYTDARTGPPQYRVDLKLGISVLLDGNDPVVQVGGMDAIGIAVLDTLLTDITFVSMNDSEGNPLLETFPTWDQNTEYFKDGEAYYAESRTVLNLGYAIFYEPAGGAILEEIVIAMPQLQDLIIPPTPQQAAFYSGFYLGF